jgi:hypothetical protein
MEEERDFEDFQISVDNIDDCIKNMEALKKSIPDEVLNIIKSKNKYFIEPGVPFIRSWENCLWAGKTKNFKPKYIMK